MAGTLVAVAVGFGGPGANAAPARADKMADEICIPAGSGWIVDKTRLASYLLKAHPFNLGAVPLSAPPRLAGLDPRRRVVADASICRGNADCGPADLASVRSFRGAFGALLAGLDPAFTPSVANLEPEAYVTGANQENAIRCTQPQTPGQPRQTATVVQLTPGVEAAALATTPAMVTPAPPTPAVPPFYSNFRIRGQASDLYIDRSEGIFKSASQASASLASDGVTGKTTSTLEGVIGYNIPTTFLNSGSGESLSLIPYVGIDRVLTAISSGKTGKGSATEIVSGGFLLTTLFATEREAPVHRINLRTTFLSNLRDDSSIASLNLQYVPIIDHVPVLDRLLPGFAVNSYFPLKLGGTWFASLRPTLDARVDTGAYTNHGNATVRPENRDFVRLGGQAGGSLLSEFPEFPVEIRSTYTGLYGAAGRRNIGLFENSVNWSLFSDKYVLLSLKYSNGNREDTAERQQSWFAGITVRY